MEQRFTGGCLCGAVRYESTSDRFAQHYCHCTDCQKTYGGPFGVGFVVVEAKTKLAGEVARYTKTSDSGHRKSHLFCPKCGSPLGEQVEEFPGVIVLAVGSLDDPSVFRPEAHYWVTSKQPWVNIADDLPQLDGQPE